LLFFQLKYKQTAIHIRIKRPNIAARANKNIFPVISYAPILKKVSSNQDFDKPVSFPAEFDVFKVALF